MFALLVLTAAACGSDEGAEQTAATVTTTTTTLPVTTTTAPPATTVAPTTAPSTTITQPVVTTTVVPFADPFWFGEPIAIDARDVVGALSSPVGWMVWIDDSGTLLIDDGSADCGEEGESCAALWVAIDSYVGTEVPGFTEYLAAAEATGVAEEARPAAAMQFLIDTYYAWIGAQDWWTLQFDPLEVTPAQVGEMPGFHFGYRGVRDDTTIQHTDAYMAYDGMYLYIVMVRMPELIPMLEPIDTVALFAPSLAEIVADLRLPPPTEAITPELAADWTLESGDFLVSRADGVFVVRGGPVSGSVAHVVTSEPVSQAHHDRRSGIVFQIATPRKSGAVHPLEMAIWWVPEPGADPIVLHEPDPGKPAMLFGVAEIDAAPHALYMVAEADGPMAGFVLVAHDLATGEPRRVGEIGGGEVWPDCVSWAIDRFLVSKTAEENTFFVLVSIDGEAFLPEAPFPPSLQPSAELRTWYASSCAALRESDGRTAVVRRTFEGPNHLVIVDIATGTAVQSIEIDAETISAGAEEEMWPGNIGWWETRVQFVGDQVLISDLSYGVSEPFVVDLTSGEITMLPVGGMATWVR
jgi:hypothetical protein